MRHIVLAAVCLSASFARAGEIGDPAPPLQIAEWVKGGPVDLTEGKDKTVYVVEFWGTWCAPCRETIPQLSEVARTYKDKGVVVIGVTDEKADVVKPFVADLGDRMDYVVAVDDARKTTLAYTEGFHAKGTPWAFVIDKTGAVAWHGSTRAGVGHIVELVAAGKWSAAIAKKAEEAGKVMQEYFKEVQTGDPAKAKELGAKFLEMAGAIEDMLNQFAWTLLTEPALKNRDMELAMQAAKAAYDACEGKSAEIVDTYARALWDTGKKGEAIEMQKKAVEMCKDEKMREELKKTLDDYEAKAEK